MLWVSIRITKNLHLYEKISLFLLFSRALYNSLYYGMILLLIASLNHRLIAGHSTCAILFVGLFNISYQDISHAKLSLH